MDLWHTHYNDVIMGAIASQITSLTIVYSTVYSDADQRKHQSSASLAFVRGIHRGPVNSPHKWPVTRKMFPFDDVIMWYVYSFIIDFLCRFVTNQNTLLRTVRFSGISTTVYKINEACDFSHNNMSVILNIDFFLCQSVTNQKHYVIIT